MVISLHYLSTINGTKWTSFATMLHSADIFTSPTPVDILVAKPKRDVSAVAPALSARRNLPSIWGNIGIFFPQQKYIKIKITKHFVCITFFILKTLCFMSFYKIVFSLRSVFNLSLLFPKTTTIIFKIHVRIKSL